MKLRGIFTLQEFTNPNGSTSWRVTGTKHDGARVRENFKTEGEAKGRRSELEIEAGNGDTSTRITATRLTAAQMADADCAITLLKDRKVTLAGVAQFYLDNWREPVTAKPLADAIKDFIADKTSEKVRPDTLRNLRGRLGWLEKRLPGVKVGEIPSDTVRKLLMRAGLSQQGRKNDRAAWNNFFNWALERKFTAANPIAPIKAKQFKGDDKEPEVMPLADVRKLLNAAYEYKDGKCFPYVALGLFAGLRPDKELARITWANIDLKQKLIRVSGDIAKKRGRRNVEVSANLVAMLRPFALRNVQIKPKNWLKDFSRVKRAAGYKSSSLTLRKGESQDQLKEWPQDILRHTAVSFHYAKHKHEGRTAEWAGNSPDVIHKHYRGLVPKKDVRPFWQMQVEPKATKIIALKAAA